MNKPFTFVLFFLLWSASLLAQDYQVSKISGEVHDGNRLLAKDDWIKRLDKLTATADAAIRLSSAKNGTVILNFVQGKKVAKNEKSEKSELYELVVQDYVDKFTTHKQTGVLGVPQEFDWFAYFYQYPDTVAREMLIVEGEKLPFQSRVFPKSKQEFKIFARIYTNASDTASVNLQISQDSIAFPAAGFAGKKVFMMDIYLAFTDKDGHQTANVTQKPIEAHYLTRQEFRDLMAMFNDRTEKNYKNAVDAKSNFYSFLDFNYVRCFWPLIQQQADPLFK